MQVPTLDHYYTLVHKVSSITPIVCFLFLCPHCLSYQTPFSLDLTGYLFVNLKTSLINLGVSICFTLSLSLSLSLYLSLSLFSHSSYKQLFDYIPTTTKEAGMR